MLCVEHGFGHALFEETELGALRDGVADGELDHVVGPGEQRDHVVKNAGTLDVRAVFEVELLRLEVVLVERSGDQAEAVLVLGKGQVGQDVFLLLFGEVPEHDDSVREDKHLAEVLRVGNQAVDGAHRELAAVELTTAVMRAVQCI